MEQPTLPAAPPRHRRATPRHRRATPRHRRHRRRDHGTGGRHDDTRRHRRGDLGTCGRHDGSARRGGGQGHRLRRVCGWIGRRRHQLAPGQDRLHQSAGRLDRRHRHERRRRRHRCQVHQRRGRWDWRPPDRGGAVLHRRHRRGRPAVRTAVRQRRRDRRRRDGPDGDRDRVVLRGDRRREAGDRRRVGQPRRHAAGQRGGPVRRRAVHPGAVRDVRRGRLGRDVSGAGLSGRCRSGRRRRRTGFGVRDSRHPDQRRALPAQRARPHSPVARR